MKFPLKNWSLFHTWHVDMLGFRGRGPTRMIGGAELWLFGDRIHWNLRATTSGSDLYHGCGWWDGYTRWHWESGAAKRYKVQTFMTTFNKKYKTRDILFFSYCVFAWPRLRKDFSQQNFKDFSPVKLTSLGGQFFVPLCPTGHDGDSGGCSKCLWHSREYWNLGRKECHWDGWEHWHRGGSEERARSPGEEKQKKWKQGKQGTRAPSRWSEHHPADAGPNWVCGCHHFE